MPIVKVNGKSVAVEHGVLLSQVFIDLGLSVAHPCAGQGICRRCWVNVNGEAVLSCQYRVETDIAVQLAEDAPIHAPVTVEAEASGSDPVCLVLDIGSTTLVLAAVSRIRQTVQRAVTANNPQRVYGADVMSRIAECQKHGPEAMHRLLIGEINRMIASLSLPERTDLYVSGNSTMLHLFWGEDPSGMGVSPFTPVFLEGRQGEGDALGLQGVNRVESLPSISAFVGADLVAGLLQAPMPKDGAYSLLIDLGTNAEVVLFSKQDVLCTAAAAGPCFEGANISCGMAATAGAICGYAEDGSIQTIGNAKPIGLCGTGLIDCISVLLERGVIDETGYMECERVSLAEGVYLCQEDVRQYQLAKSAVCAAVLTLMEVRGVTAEQIERVYLSGGFSAAIDVASAAKTGLLPHALAEKCVSLGNSSLLGTCKYALTAADPELLLRHASYLDLSPSPVFSRLFIENMSFEAE